MKDNSLGMIETWGIVGAIMAADAACKSANVKLIGYELNAAGFATIKLAGDVGSVRAAVSAGVAAVGGEDKVVASHVIPRLGQGMEEYTFDSPDNVPGPPAPAPPAAPESPAATEPADPVKPKEAGKDQARKKPAKSKPKPKDGK